MATGDDVRIHGKNGAIYINGPKGVGNKITAKTEWTLNLNRDYVDVTAFGDRNKHYVAGLKDISGTYQGHLDVSGDFGVNAVDLDAIPVYLYADDRTGHELLIAYGLGLMDATISVSSTDSPKVTGNMRASDDWTVFTAGSLVVGP
jgi:hypothetical protein